MIVGIGGVSTSGKTTLASRLKVALPSKSLLVICQDDYINHINDIPKIKSRVDWEHPLSINQNTLHEAILSGTDKAEIVIAEGLMIFQNYVISSLFTRRIFIDLNYATFKERKKADNRWGSEPDWYVEHIWNSYLTYGLPEKNMKDILRIDGAKSYDITQIINYLYHGKLD
ncbi:MAG: hypothetical protein Q8S18_00545 [Bacteroidales bacterium]|nr:hypothetical protein [Bacteroidales bacterium]